MHSFFILRRLSLKLILSSLLFLISACPNVDDAIACRDQDDCLDDFFCWQSDFICHDTPEDLSLLSDGGIPPSPDGGTLNPAPDGGTLNPAPDGGTLNPTDAGPTPSPFIVDFTVGQMGVCALKSSGETFCAGSNSAGQLTGTAVLNTLQSFSPIPGISDVTDIALASRFSCFIGTKQGINGLYCMGDGSRDNAGALQNERAGYSAQKVLFTDDNFIPVEVALSGQQGGCARDASDVYCWGPELSRSMNLVAAPTRIPNLSASTAFYSGAGFLCAKSAGEVSCIKSGGLIHFGCASSGLTRCSMLDDAQSFSASASAACLIKNNKVQCAGDNRYGIADPTNPTSDSLVPGFIDVRDSVLVVVHSQGACALGTDGKVRCWGRNLWNWNGQGPTEIGNSCGGGAASAKCHLPQEVPDVENATDLKGSYGFMCAYAEGITLRCWGQNSGSTGIDPTRFVLP